MLNTRQTHSKVPNASTNKKARQLFRVTKMEDLPLTDRIEESNLIGTYMKVIKQKNQQYKKPEQQPTPGVEQD
jgi:hypothetical protein